MHIGDVTTWDTGCTAHEQALKPLEEASEVHGAWQPMASAELAHGGYCVLARLWRKRLLNECADVIQATCNLLAMLGVEDFAPYMAECLEVQKGRGRL